METKPEKKVTMELHPKEVELIMRIRNKYRWGVINIETRDGLPDYILKEIVRDRL